MLNRLALLYAGVLMGVSFVATPAKFLVEEIPRSDLLLVGRATFDVFQWVELAFILVLIVGTRCIHRMRMLVAGLALMVVFQQVVIRPILDERLLAMYAGQSVLPAHWHTVYGVLEGLKLGVLLVMGFRRCGDVCVAAST